MPRKTTKPRVTKATSGTRQTAEYRHKEETPARPDVGVQPQFKKRAAPKTWRYDSSFSPALNWDGQNAAREQGEALLRQVLDAKDLTAAKAAAGKLKALSKPFLNWSGKAERLSFDVPTLPLFVHERLSTRAILETLKGHKRDKQLGLFDLFADPQRPIHEQVLRAYEYQDKWVNRMILGDSLVVVNSLLHYESLGGQVQMIYMDPPYGVKFGSNFQPFVRKRDVSHGDDDDMTREPEMVQAYRDTWELGLHSYLTYMRDRLLLSREILAPSGSIFVQISDDNLHHVRELLDEVFGAENFCRAITFAKTSGLGSAVLQSTRDFLLWYAKDKSRVKFRQIFTSKIELAEEDSHYQRDDVGRLYTLSDLSGQFADYESFLYDYEYEGRSFKVSQNRRWKTPRSGMDQLAKAGRIVVMGNSLRFKRYLSDFPVLNVTDDWHDIGGSVQSRSDPKIYVVQSGTAPIQRCVLMTTDPGDIVLDPTCGSGTTAYVAEQWGRRWITIDTSRVPLALARQRLLTATYPWYELRDESSGPGGGFVYKRRQNQKGEEIGGIVPHIMLSTIANNEPPLEEVLVDRPEETKGITRVTGPFVVEATIPTAMDLESPASQTSHREQAGDVSEHGDFIERMLEVLRRSPVLRLEVTAV